MTAIMRAEHQEPEVARFIDSYKYDQQSAERRQKYGGGTSLPLDSDGYEDRQRKLKEELRNDFLVQQEKPSDPVYFRVGTPEQGLRGLGQYEQLRQEMNVKRQQEYNDFLREKKNLELQKIEARRNRPPPPVTQPPAGQIDYDEQNLRARTEDKRAYQDHMGKYHQTQAVTVKPPINYEEERRRLSEELKEEYNQFRAKKAQEERYLRMRGKPVTPPGGLDIGHYDKHVKEQAPQKKKEYKETLDQQRNEKLQHLAWERVADISPSHMHYRDEERPLVGSPRDVNFYMREKEEKDKFGLLNRELKPDLKTKDTPLDKSTSAYQRHVAIQLAKRDEENFTRYLEVEKERRKNQKIYREELMKQQKEQMYIRARQEPELPVLDRSPPQQATYLASKPPPGPQHGHTQRNEPSNQQTPNYWNDGKRERSPVSLVSESSKHSKASKNNGVPSAFRTYQYVGQAPQKVSQTENTHQGDAQTMNGQNQMYRQQPPLPRSPEKFRRSSPPPLTPNGQFEGHTQRQEPKSQVVNGGVSSYQPSFQERGQRQSERHRPTPSAFQTHQNADGNYAEEGALERLPLRESSNFDNQEQPTAPRENPPIGGLYVFDDSKHDKIKRQIYETKKKDYAEYLQRKQDEERRRHEESRRNRGAPAGFQKDHHYSSDEYEKFQRNLHKIEEADYRDFLKKEFEPKGSIGLPLGQYKYEPKRLLMEHERNTDYNAYTRKEFQPPLQAQGLPLGQYIYEPKRLALEAERNREYNALLRSKPKTPKQIDGPQGLNIDVSYQDKKKVFLEKERNRDYNELIRKDDDQMGYGQHAQYPYRYNENVEHSLNPSQEYPSQSQPAHFMENPFDSRQSERIVTPQRPQRSSHQQTSENMQAVMTHVEHKPPVPPVQQQQHSSQQNNTNLQKFEESYVPTPLKDTMNPYKTNPNRFYDQMTAPYRKAPSAPAGYSSIPATPTKLSLPVGGFDEARAFNEKQRNREYNDFVSKLPPVKPSKGGLTPQATALTLPVGGYDTLRPSLERQRNEEYNQLKKEGLLDKRKVSLRKKAPTPPDQQGLFECQSRYEGYIKNMERQRNREYNEFLKKKYTGGKMTSRSEPDRPNASFYVGAEEEQDMKKRYLAEERSRQYKQMLREQEPPRSRSVNIPSDVDSGLPIGQQHHEARRQFLREQRNREYNQMMDTKNREVRNREWNFGNSGILELRGDDENQSRKLLLREERQKEYNEYMNQTQKKLNRTWPEPDGRGALLVKKGEYDNVRNMYSNERKQELQQYLNEKDPKQQAPHTQQPRSRSQPISSGYRNNFNPFVNAFGKYHDTRQKLAEDRKKEFKIFMAEKKKHEVVPKRSFGEAIPKVAKEEKPLVNSMGLYESETRKKFLLERKKDFASYNQEQEKGWTPRNNVKENLMPHVASAETPLVNYMGHYDEEKSKFRVQRNKDFKEFSYKKKQEYHSPYENFVYPMVAVAEKPLVEHMGRDIEQRRLELRQERRHDYERYQSQQRIRDPPRRNDYSDPRNGPYDGIFSGLGDHGNTKEVLGLQRKQEYNEYLDHYPQTKAGGRPTWVKDTLPNNTDRGRSPMRNPQPVDHYQQMLDEKRREEAQRRRFDDPEYQGRLPPNSREARYTEDMQQQKYGYYQQE